MSQDLEDRIEQEAHRHVVRLNAVVQGLTIGIMAGLAIFAATNFLILKGGANVGQHLKLVGQFFIGYRVTFVGSLIGFAYAFICGYLVGYVVARLYNGMVDLRYGKRGSLDKSR